MKLRTLLFLSIAVAVVAALAWGAMRVVRATTATAALELPTTKVKQGRVTLTVAARGELQGGNSEMLTAPMIGSDSMAITSLKEPGELLSSPAIPSSSSRPPSRNSHSRNPRPISPRPNSRSSKPKPTPQATDEESHYAMLSAEADVKQAQIECRRNPLIAAIAAKQNDLALEAAVNRQRQTRPGLHQQKDHLRRRHRHPEGPGKQGQSHGRYRPQEYRQHDSQGQNRRLCQRPGQHQPEHDVLGHAASPLPTRRHCPRRHGRRPDPRPQQLGSQRQRR